MTHTQRCNERAGAAVGVDREAELPVDVQEPLYQKPVPRIQRRVVVAPEKAERRQANRRRDVLGQDPLRRLGHPALRDGERHEDVRDLT